MPAPFNGLFSEINLDSEKLGKRYADRNDRHLRHIDKIIDTYQYRKEEEHYARRVLMETIVANDYNLNISRYISTAVADEAIDLTEVNTKLIEIEQTIKQATEKHNRFLKELGLPLLPE
nr:N-6 DNA methylase [Candidatus Viridilinea mediisalina]